MKKVLSTILVGIMAVCGLIAFTGCEDGKSVKDVFKKEITYKVVTEDFFFNHCPVKIPGIFCFSIRKDCPLRQPSIELKLS